MRAIVVAAATVLCAFSVAAQAPVKPTNRSEATAIIADARKVVTPRGIERHEMLLIGGIPQWVSIRGTDRTNPVLLYIHGGPGYVSMPMSWYFARGWEDYFTVVQWDQRAAGKTHLGSNPQKVAQTLTRDRMIADAQEMLAWTRRELKADKVFVLGHSWGSYLGLELARRNPESIHAYIGVGQLADGPESERRGWQFAMDQARKAGNAEAIRELESIAPYPAPDGRVELKDLYLQRRWVGEFGGVMAYRTNNASDSALAWLSPDYTDEEILRIWEGNAFAAPYLLDEVVALDMSTVARLECPLLLFLGRHDRNVNSQVAAEWFEQVNAPRKQLVWFEHSAHMPMTEEPGKFLVSLVTVALPIARGGAASHRFPLPIVQHQH